MNAKKYDFLIVGAGLYGCVCAHELTKKGYSCLVIDKRSHIGGNCYTEKINNTHVHKYGAHIFHTNSKEIWDYITQFACFNNYVNEPVAIAPDNKIYNLPFNMNTFAKIWPDVTTPAQAKKRIAEQTEKYRDVIPANLEEQALKMVGDDIYNLLIKGYTEKQWGRKATELPADIIKRLPLRFSFDNNYFNDKYQGIPIGGYTKIFKKMLEGIDVMLETDFLAKRYEFKDVAKEIIYTGPIDALFNYCYGELDYRSLRFETYSVDESQGNAVVNFTDANVPYTRTIEHRFFDLDNFDDSHILKTFEYPDDYGQGKEPYYPINDSSNNTKYQQYLELASETPGLYVGGRLGDYKYYDMHITIDRALTFVKLFEPKQDAFTAFYNKFIKR